MTSSEKTSTGEDQEVVRFGPLDPALAADFWPRTNDLRERCPVGWSDQPWSEGREGFWVVNDYADVMAASTDWRGFSNAQGAAPVQFDLDVLRMIPLETDPPLHRGIRRLLNPFFTVGAQQAGEAGIREKVDTLLGRCLDRGEVDFVASFTQLLPPVVFFETYLEQRESEIGWVLDVLNTLLTQPERAMEVAPKLLGWGAELLAARRAAGRRDDLAGTIAHLGLDGSDGLELDEKQRIETMNLMIMAGMETTMGGLGSIAVQLAGNPSLREELRAADEKRLDRAVDEFLRFESPVPTAGRTLAADVEMGGCPMKSGDRALLNWAAANRDPGQFPHPDTLDFDRDNTSSHVAFGAGIHRCLGNHLARREIKASIRAICALTTFESEPGFTPDYRPGFARGPVSLPVRLAR
ncbi:cytochrome P450 [Streptomyces sp. GQFP]|uniref:cytochrome P450 n=1 Tax=Streptomyces sp. GQFP TaxID=2907545 RepID=UPI001F1F9D22|nr:cytochrome P450 [Streptomyces sp. GQFP]UIX29388.1 cytochrome P450 [Streptomyces sp. GQFP]